MKQILPIQLVGELVVKAGLGRGTSTLSATSTLTTGPHLVS